MSVGENLKRVRDGIEDACARAGRQPSEITLIAVSKTVEPQQVFEGIRAGATDLGENWVQEAVGKRPIVERMLREGNAECRMQSAECRAPEPDGPRDDAREGPNQAPETKNQEPGTTNPGLRFGVRWHMIGHLQTNKVKKALEVFDTFQGVDSLRLAQELDRRAAQAGRTVDALMEVNTSGEASKFGVPPEQVSAIAREIVGLKNVRLQGLMTIGPGLSVEDPEVARPCFRLLRELRDRLQAELGVPLPCLSMGMSSDYAVAIQEGATMLRIGTAIFGARTYPAPR